MLNEATTATEQEGDPPLGRDVFSPTENFIQANVSNINRPATIEEIEAACAECRAYNGGEGFFGRQWDNRVAELLLPSYKLLCLVDNDPVRLGIAIAQFGLKPTRAALKNDALICVSITADPRDTAQRKLCSGWAQILNEARAENIRVEDFADWEKHRDKQRVRSSAADKRPEPGHSEDISHSKLGLETLRLLELLHPEVLDVVKMPGSEIERLRRMGNSFLMRANELAMAEEDPAAAPALTDEIDARPTTTEAADD